VAGLIVNQKADTRLSVGEGVSELTILRGGEEITVRLARQFIVGSRPDADLVIAGLPPTHIIINPGKAGALMLVLEQREQALVNGLPAQQAQRLSHGDAITVPGARLKYSSPSDSNHQLALGHAAQTSARDPAAQSSIVDSQNISWFTAESDVYRALRTLYQLSALSNSASSESALLEGALELALQGARATHGAIVVRGEDGAIVPLFVRRPARAPNTPSFALDQVLVALERGHTSVVGPPDGAATLCVPIIRPGAQPEGALCLKRAPDDTPFITVEIELVASVGRQLGSALERVRVLRTARSSTLDLTRLQRRHEAVLQAISEGLVLVGSDGAIEPLSARGATLLAQLIGRKVAFGELLEGDGAVGQLVARALQGDHTLVEELETQEDGVVRVAATRVEELGAVVLVLRDVSVQRELEEQSREGEARLLTEMVRAREQRRIGQDLHDGVCQQLVGITMLLKGLQSDLARARSPEAPKVAEIVDLLRQTTDEARELSKGLSNVGAQERSFLLALQELIDTFRRLSPGMTIKLESVGTLPTIDADVAKQLYHIVQEALSNACKHSGGTTVNVQLTSRSDGVILAIEDNGLGLSQSPERKGGMGLGNMKNRARQIGATLELGTRAPRGTRIVCSLRTDMAPRGRFA
jgi:signal transduction histidine kinase